MNRDTVLPIATAPRAGTDHWKVGQITWGEVLTWVDSPRTGQKNGPGYVLGVLRETTKDHKGKKGCVGLHRIGEAVVSRSVITLDADKLTPATRDALLVALRATGWAALVYSTASSTPAAPRLRILLLPDRVLTPDEYRLAVKYLIGLLGRELFDPTCAEPERLMYMPTTPAKGEFYSKVLEGVPLGVDALLLDAMLEDPESVAEASIPPASAGTDQTLYADLSPERRALADEKLARTADNFRRRLAEVVDWPEGERDEHGRGWEALTRDAAFRLAQLGYAPWSSISLDAAEALYNEMLPPAVASDPKCAEKWPSRATLRQKLVLPPWDDPEWESPFSLVADEPGKVDAVLRRFPRLDLAELLSTTRPPREWVIDNLIPAGTSGALVAPAGTGKSLLLLAAMISVARGDKTFAGLSIPRGRRIVLVDMENTEDDLADRLKALGITLADVASLDSLVILHLPPLSALDTPAGGKEFVEILDAYQVKTGDVIVLDSFQRVVKGPENDSDTLRDFVRCTALELKRRRLTVIRTDNTGKDADKGARGTSGKRDDVDLELLLTRDPDHPDRLRIKPGKVRLPGINAVLISRDVDDDGHLTFTTAGDPFRALVGDAHQLLEQLDIPVETGERKAAEIIKAHGGTIVRAALRVAIKERKNPFESAPQTSGAVVSVDTEKYRAEQPRRADGAGD